MSPVVFLDEGDHIIGHAWNYPVIPSPGDELHITTTSDDGMEKILPFHVNRIIVSEYPVKKSFWSKLPVMFIYVTELDESSIPDEVMKGAGEIIEEEVSRIERSVNAHLWN